MPNESTLDTAVARGIISTEQANSIRLIESEEPNRVSTTNSAQDDDDEGFRFITGFSDIFLAIGVIVLLSGVLKTNLLSTVVGTLIIAAICWGLSEIVATWQRRSLPSMVSAAGFVFFLIFGGFAYIAGTTPYALIENWDRIFLDYSTNAWILPAAMFGASLIYYARFKLPFSLFMAAVGFAGAILTMLFQSLDTSTVSNIIIPVLLGTGLLVFCAAVYFDSRDPVRQTRFSDNAFWLHLVASPLIVHSIMWQSALWLAGSDSFSFASIEQFALPLSMVVLAIFVVLMIIALIINRRAMLVSSLIYVTLALTYLGSETGGVASLAAFVPIILGAGILSIGIGWQTLRKALFAILPLEPIRTHLSPVK